MTDAPKIITRAEAKAAGLTYYYTNKPCKHGHLAERFVSNTHCEICNRIRTTAFYAASPEKQKQVTARWRAANPDKIREMHVAYYSSKRDSILAYGAAYRADNAEKERARCEAYRNANPEQRKISQAAWRAANPEMCAAHCRNRRARVRMAEGKHTAEDIQRIFQRQRGKCAICRASIQASYHADHITPISRGGTNWPKNIQLTCPSCNLKKSAKDVIEHMQSLGFLL